MAKFGTLTAPAVPGIEGVPSRIVVIRVVVVTMDELDPGVKERVAVVVVVDTLFDGGDGDDSGAGPEDDDNGGLRLEKGLRGAVVGLTAGGRMTRWNVYASWGVS